MTQIFLNQLAQMDEQQANIFKAFHTSVPCWVTDRNMVVIRIMRHQERAA